MELALGLCGHKPGTFHSPRFFLFLAPLPTTSVTDAPWDQFLL